MNTSLKTRTLHIVTQTHWDREWYLPHQTTVGRLLHVMATVVEQLECGELETFLFDGQTAGFEDLMQHAEDALIKRVRSLCAAKRIVLGPWYVMADEFLCAGESLLRNLEFGLADASAAGNCQMIGYLPDNFGHVSQMPQILRNFNIDSAVLWRGADAKDSEFDWQGNDGSVVGTVFLTQGYYQHPFNVPDYAGALAKYLALIAPRTTATNLLLTQGGDHLAPVAGLAEKISAFNKSQTEFTATQSTLEKFTHAALAETKGARQVIAGELRYNTQAFVLPDVLSTRRYLKYLNQTAEDALLGRIEPFYAMLNLSEALPSKYLEATWRLLVQQHAHDSICGCSVDSVHSEMRTRFLQIMQRIGALQSRAAAAAGLVNLTQHGSASGANTAAVFADDSVITLFNPSPKPFAGVTVQRVFLGGTLAADVTVKSIDGQVVEASLLKVEAGHEFHSPLDDFPDRVEGGFYSVAINVQLAGTTALGFRVEKSAFSAPVAVQKLAAIENQIYTVCLEADNTLTITDKRDGTKISEAFAFVSTSDAGDSYNYSPPATPTTVRQAVFTHVSTKITPLIQELYLKVELAAPVGLNADRSAAQVETVSCTGVLRIRLSNDSAGLHCKLKWVNRARDQRTRLHLNLPTGTLLTHTYSDSAFSMDARPIKLAQIPSAITRQEMPVVVEPSYSTIVADRLYFCHRAMQEYEMQAAPNGHVLTVTMVRSVGWMSRRDLVTRGVGAGPDMETPEAQCLGEDVFDFEVGLLGATAMPADACVYALNRAQHLRRPLVQLRGQSNQWHGAVQINNVALQVSSLRRIRDFVELRVWNPLATAQAVQISSAAGWQFCAVYADGRARDGGLTLAPFGFLTLRVNANASANANANINAAKK